MKPGAVSRKPQAGDSRRGNAMIEFALSFTFLFSALAGAFEFGYSYQLYNTMESGVRNAARYASLRTYDSATATPSAGFTAAVANMAVYGNPDGTGTAIVPGLGTGNIAVTMTFDRGAPYLVKVAVVNYAIDAVFAQFTLSGKPSAAFVYLGRYAPPV